MSDDETPTFEPDPNGPRRLTWFSKILIVLVLASPGYFLVQAIQQPEPTDDPKKSPGIQAKTDYNISLLMDDEYRRTLSTLFNEANEKIFVAMLVIKAPSLYKKDWPEWREDRVLSLMRQLKRAHDRGVEVKVIVSEIAANNEKSTANKATINWLNKRGITAGVNQTPVKLHDKVIIVDKSWVVQGSHNWTPGALSTNKEVSILFKPQNGTKWSWKRYWGKLSVGLQ